MTTKPEIVFSVRASPVDDFSDFDGMDKDIQNSISERLEEGDVWAWCVVIVSATCEGFIGNDYLHACSYKDEKDFIENSGYYEQMKEEAIADLRNEMCDAVKRGDLAKLLLNMF